MTSPSLTTCLCVLLTTIFIIIQMTSKKDSVDEPGSLILLPRSRVESFAVVISSICIAVLGILAADTECPRAARTAYWTLVFVSIYVNYVFVGREHLQTLRLYCIFVWFGVTVSKYDSVENGSSF